MTEQIKVTRDGAVESIAFANPPLNFITRGLSRAMIGH